MGFYAKERAAGGSFDMGVRDSVAAILASPHFLYRAEAATERVRELTDLELASRGDQFAATITARLMTYGVGRTVDHHDMPTVRRIVREAAAKNYTFESLVLGVVKSDAFRRRAPSPPVLIAAQGGRTVN